MSDANQDPAGNTQAFRAFVQRDEPAPARSNLPLIIGGVAAVIVIALVITAFLTLG
jgi:hypothetical protein